MSGHKTGQSVRSVRGAIINMYVPLLQDSAVVDHKTGLSVTSVRGAIIRMRDRTQREGLPSVQSAQ